MPIERSPRFPADALPDALERVEALYKSAGRSSVTSEIAAQAIGYTSLSGASRTALAALNYYGLLQREGDSQRVSELGLRLMRPLDALDRLEAARISAFRPPVFAEIRKEHGDCSESLLASVLLRRGFTDDGAGRAARVYKENEAFIQSLERDASNVTDDAPMVAAEPRQSITSVGVVDEGAKPRKLLAQYQIPLGSNQAQLTISGEELLAEDFDALADYVRLFKQQFDRQASNRRSTTPPVTQ